MGKRSGSAVRNRNAETPPPAPEPLSVAVPDSHTHMDMQVPDVARIVAEAAAVGVSPLVQVGIDVRSSQWAADIATEQDTNTVWAAVALHPNEAPRVVHGDGAAGVEVDDSDWAGKVREAEGIAGLDAAVAEIDRLAAHPRVCAVGETGLDYYRTGAEGTHAQQESFRRHIGIAKRHGKALMIHDRDAHDDVLRILEEEGAPERVVLHCFSGDADMAKVCADRGYHMSFAGNVTFGTAHQLREAAEVAPSDLVLVETDAPFLTPKPYRGRPNAPYLIPHTLRALAEVKRMTEEELATAVADNARRVFGF